jgi:hypothetical protein
MASAVVQLAIGVVFIFFLVGSACSFLNELVTAIIDRRAAHLERWLRKMLGRDADAFFDHTLTKSLRRPRSRQLTKAPAGTADNPGAADKPQLSKRKVPSYISAATFATVLLSMMAKTQDKAGATGSTPGSTTPLEPRINVDNLNDETLKPQLRTLLADANGDVAQFRNRLERWFTEEMDRLSGWYKRRTKWFLLLWGLGLAVFLNVDAALVAKTLWTDSTLRSAVVTQAQQTAAPPTTAGGASTPTTTPPCPASGANGSSDSSTTTTDPLECLEARINTLGSLQLPIGWPGLPWQKTVYTDTDRRTPHNLGGWWLKALGLLITALAAMQGGPFWFELLGKLVNLRLTGPPPSRPADSIQTQTDQPARPQPQP